MRTSFSPARYIGLTLLVVGIVASGFAAWQYFGAQSAAPLSAMPAVPAPLQERKVSEGMAGEGTRVYRNSAYRFQLSYPQSLTVREYDEADGALSVTFENSAEEKGFQIYVTPYQRDHITEERFRLDNPSGVRIDPVEVVVDGTRGVAFFSQNPYMGETREVWFIKNGFLYEVATYMTLDTWLADIMKTWKFLPIDAAPNQ